MRPTRVGLAVIWAGVAAAAVLLAFHDVSGQGTEPPLVPVLRVPCHITSVIDGDTVEVEVRTRVRVRLLDCWAEERDTPDGQQASEYLRGIAEGREGLLEVDLSPRGRLDDVFSFGRVLGRVYVGGQDVGERVVGSGHASRHGGGRP